jgi:Recombination endonuclease VII
MISKKTGLVYPSHTKASKRKGSLKELGWKEQDGKCANVFCGKILNLSTVQNSARACADHEHRSLCPRGILCSTCNIMLGQAQDNPDILRGGAEYLEKFLLAKPAEEVQNTK